MPRAAWSSRGRGLSGASAHGLYGGWRVGGQRGILGRQLHEGLALGVPLEELDLPQIVEPRVDLELAALVLLAHQGIAQEVVDLPYRHRAGRLVGGLEGGDVSGELAGVLRPHPEGL